MNTLSIVTTFLLLASPITAIPSTKPPIAKRHRFPSEPPILLDRSGGFLAGGVTIPSPTDPTQTLTCDHGYMEYFIPSSPLHSTSLIMWHSATTQAFQNRWDGGIGYKDIFLRRQYPVYLWDGPRVGRANWACEAWNYEPAYRDQSNFAAWNFGPQYPIWWNDTQFPYWDKEAWRQATGGRYVEFDTLHNLEIETDAVAVAADEGKLGDSVVYITNSAAGFRALLTTIKSKSGNIKGIVMYETVGYVFPDNIGVANGTLTDNPFFGPLVVPVEDFMRLTEIPIQFIWSDHRTQAEAGVYWQQVEYSKVCAKAINDLGGKAEIFYLGIDAGLKGSTHSAFADMDNVKVANLLEGWLGRNGLDAYTDDFQWV